MKEHNLQIVVAGVVAFAVFLFTPLYPTGDDAIPRIIGESSRPWLISLLAIIGIPFNYAAPSLRAGFMGMYWKVPSTAYIFPRWFLRMACGAITGNVAAMLVLALTRDQPLLWLLPIQFLCGAALCFGTWRRLRKPASNEFTMPWWPRSR